jgi:predicted lactoylglutathione lyase
MEMNQVTLPVKDMELAVSFYLKLSFTQIVDTPHYARFVCTMAIQRFLYH